MKNILFFFILLIVISSSCVERLKDQLKSDNNERYQPAEYPGGNEAMRAFIIANILPPDAVIERGINGKVTVQFGVNKDGKIVHPKIIEAISDCPECSDSVIAMVRKMPNWKPAQMGSRKFRSTFNLPIRFSGE